MARVSASWMRCASTFACISSLSEFRRMANSSPPSRASTSDARTHDSSRRETAIEQLVAGQMAQAVVDHLERSRSRNRTANRPALCSLKCTRRLPIVSRKTARLERPVSGSHQHRRAASLQRRGLFGDVLDRSGDDLGTMIRTARGDATAQEPAIGAVLVTDAVLVKKIARLTGQMCVERVFQRHQIIRMDPIEPILEHGRDPTAPRVQPVPAIVKTRKIPGCGGPTPRGRRWRRWPSSQSVPRLFERVLRAPLFSDVVPDDRRAIVARHDVGVESTEHLWVW